MVSSLVEPGVAICEVQTASVGCLDFQVIRTGTAFLAA